MDKIINVHGGGFNPPPSRIDFNGVPVVTTEMLAEFYECEVINIQKNFNANKEHFGECKHYYKLEGDRLKEFKERYLTESKVPFSKFAPTLYLWTKQGAARHAKMLTTEKAWKVFEILEDTYFTVAEEKKQKRERVDPPKDEMSLKMKVDYLLKLAESAPTDKLKEEIIRRAATLIDGKKSIPATPQQSSNSKRKTRKFRVLSVEQIQEIRRLYYAEHMKIRNIAKMFHVSIGSVCNAINEDPVI